MSIYGTNHPGTSGGHKKSPQYPGQDGHPHQHPGVGGRDKMPPKATPGQAGKLPMPGPGGHPHMDSPGGCGGNGC